MTTLSDLVTGLNADELIYVNVHVKMQKGADLNLITSTEAGGPRFSLILHNSEYICTYRTARHSSRPYSSSSEFMHHTKMIISNA